MTKKTIEMFAPQDDTDVVLLIPNGIVGDGEAGDPLTAGIIQILNGMAAAHWAPLDFGEMHETCTELWFYRTGSPEEARLSAQHFVNCGGYV